MADSLASNALITAEEYIALRGEELTDKTNVEQLYSHINAASEQIEQYLCRIVCPVTSVEEIFDGDGTKDYWVLNRRITAAPSLYYWDGTQWVEMTTAAYYWTYQTKGRIYFQRGYTFSAGEDNYKVTYSTGWAITSVPPDIKLACYEMVERQRLRAEGKQGVQSESFGDQTTSFSLEKMSDNVTRLLAPYRNLKVG